MKKVITIKSGEKLKVKLMNGGGWVSRLVISPSVDS